MGLAAAQVDGGRSAPSFRRWVTTNRPTARRGHKRDCITRLGACFTKLLSILTSKCWNKWQCSEHPTIRVKYLPYSSHVSTVISLPVSAHIEYIHISSNASNGTNNLWFEHLIKYLCSEHRATQPTCDYYEQLCTMSCNLNSHAWIDWSAKLRLYRSGML